MSRTPPRHGTRSCYSRGCRCDDCREATRLSWHEMQKTRATLGRRATATPDEVAATRQRLRLLASLGWSQPTIAEIADITNATVSRIASGAATRPRITTLWALDATYRQLTSRDPGAEKSPRAGVGASWAPRPEHGTYARWASGCRCQSCHKAARDYQRMKTAEYRAARRQAGRGAAA